ncbi:phosphopantetheine-binding protein [Actinacidiphila alni]|uniref:phosphopantetheine-binding protein n=1 Tax=Actinacidiphila alni TaxID=380248 RepID=UPI0034107D94
MTPNPVGPSATATGPDAPSATTGTAGTAAEAGAIAAAGNLDPDGLRRTVAEVLGIDPDRLGEDDNLVAAGVDSVKVMTISAHLRRHRVRVSFARMIEEPTLLAWWRLVEEGRAAS